MMYDWLKEYITPIENFPIQGVVFQSISKLLQEPEAFRKVIQIFAKKYKKSPPDAIVGIEARGFVFAAVLAYELKRPFVMIRRPGKLPVETFKIKYTSEYGYSALEIEKESLQEGAKVLLVDDVLATGQTVASALQLLSLCGAKAVELACLIEISSLLGRKKVACPIFRLLKV